MRKVGLFKYLGYISKGSRGLKKKTLSIVAISVVSFLVFSLVWPAIVSSTMSNLSYQHAPVNILCVENSKYIPFASLKIYSLREGYTEKLVGEYKLDATGGIRIMLPPGDYVATAIISGPTGYHGYQEFTVRDNTNNKVVILMKSNTDHSMTIDMSPMHASKIVPEQNNVHLVKAYLTDGEESIPLFVKNEVITKLFEKLKTNAITPIDYKKLDPKVRHLLMEREKQILSYLKENIHSTNTSANLGIKDVGDIIWFSFLEYGVVESEVRVRKWHPIALVDSEVGLTHKFNLSVYYDKSFSFSSEIKTKGVSASASYEFETTYSVDHDPVIVSGGNKVTVKSEFEHVYQEGKLYVYVLLDPSIGYGTWVYAGDFYREYIDQWYPLSWDEVPYADGIGETREHYLGEWRTSHSADVSMTSSSTYSGSLSFDVAYKDIFGASATIKVTISYGTKAHHRFIYNPPTSGAYIDFYSGHFFDINTYEYIPGGGGGCPFVSVLTKAGFIIDNNILPQSEVYGGNDDWFDRYVLRYSPTLLGDKYILKLVEFENEHSYLDQVKLFAVKHDKNVHITFTEHGEMVVYTNPVTPISAVDENGTSRLDVIQKPEDGNYFTGQKGNYLILKFPFTRDNLKDGARLILRADAKMMSIFIDVKTSNGWSEIGFVEPRANWSYQGVILDRYIDKLDLRNGLQIRLRWTAYHKLDFVGLDIGTPPAILIYELNLAYAFHNKYGDVTDYLINSDDYYAELLPGDEIYLVFNNLATISGYVDYYILVEGHYYTITSNNS
ncbi:MAG: hypothetical protein ACP6IS_08355 [Candidatus Asgardarchaeia archaeon]